MHWLIFVVITLLTDSLCIFSDNYISDVYFKGRGAAAQKIFHGAIQVLAALILLPFAGIDPSTAGWPTIFAFFASGFIVSLAGIAYYRALELDDSTNLGIFLQLSPVLYLIFGWLFLGETISPLQLFAFCVILSAPLLILKTTSKRSRKIKLQAVLFAFLYVLISVIANLVFARKNATELSFVAEIALFFLGKGMGSLVVAAFNKRWRRRFSEVMHQHPRKLPRLLLVNSLLSLVANATYRLALATAPSAALASVASDSVEPIVIFFMGIVLTLINPKFGREKLNKKAILVHLAATVLVAVGVVLIQI